MSKYFFVEVKSNRSTSFLVDGITLYSLFFERTLVRDDPTNPLLPKTKTLIILLQLQYDYIKIRIVIYFVYHEKSTFSYSQHPTLHT